jgi:hypothetical protein
MSETTPKRKFWQFHLTTAIVMTLVCGFSLRFIAPSFQNEEWNLSETVSDYKSSLENKGTGYSIDIDMLQNAPPDSWDASLIVTDSAGKTLRTCHIEAGDRTPFILKNDVLYYAVFSPSSSGCRIVAVDLRRDAQLWTTNLLGIGKIIHSAYRNKIYMKLRGSNIVVYGDESRGRYIETLENDSGRMVSNTVVEGSNKMLPIWIQLLKIAVPVMLGAVASEWLIRRREARKT